MGLVARGAALGHREGELVAQPHAQRAGGLVELAGDEVHRRRADEARHELGSRRVVEIVGRADLLDQAGFITTTGRPGSSPRPGRG